MLKGDKGQRDHKKKQTGGSQQRTAWLQKGWKELPKQDNQETMGTQQLGSRISKMMVSKKRTVHKFHFCSVTSRCLKFSLYEKVEMQLFI